MPVHVRMRSQIDLILNSLDGAAAYPAREQWDTDAVNDVEYLYRSYTLLAAEHDVEQATDALRRTYDRLGYGALPEGEARQIRHERAISGVRRIMLPRTGHDVPDVLAELEREREIVPGTITPEHIMYVCPYSCPATEPEEVPPGTADPVPPAGLNARASQPCRRVPWPECDGDGAVIRIVDTGWIPAAATGHRWLDGVDGTVEDPYTTDANGNTTIVPYAGHGTFVAGTARCMARKASVYVERAFDIAGADYETNLASSLADALNRDPEPDILVFTFCTSTRDDLPLLTFNDFFQNQIRYMKGLVVLAPAGKDGNWRKMWPAAYPEVISVGALAANWRDRAHFSNYGKWVDVYAPGEDLINAFPSGTYVCIEPPIGEHRTFQGMAKWSGTSFSTPVFAGLIAARMSVTGENARQAADSLLRIACGQAVAGIGPVIYPGQACCAEGCRCRS
jgi:hypothetical protein